LLTPLHGRGRLNPPGGSLPSLARLRRVTDRNGLRKFSEATRPTEFSKESRGLELALALETAQQLGSKLECAVDSMGCSLELANPSMNCDRSPTQSAALPLGGGKRVFGCDLILLKTKESVLFDMESRQVLERAEHDSDFPVRCLKARYLAAQQRLQNGAGAFAGDDPTEVVVRMTRSSEQEEGS
jgi:hypothetical protein